MLQGIAVCCIILQRVAMIHAHDSEGALNLFAAAHADGQCCSVLQCVAMYCSMLQCFAVCCSVLPYVCDRGRETEPHQTLNSSSVLQCVAVSRSVSQCVAVCCSVLQCVAVSCSGLQWVAVCGVG